MERNNGRYPYIRRQGSGNGPHNHHHHNNANSASVASSASPSSASTATNTSHSTQYSNNSINNATTNTNVLYATVSQQQQQQQQNVPISQHDELIRYIREAWNKVSEQGEIYCNESDNQLKNFKPFNLEEYWGQRLVQNIHVTTTHQ